MKRSVPLLRADLQLVSGGLGGWGVGIHFEVRSVGTKIE